MFKKTIDNKRYHTLNYYYHQRYKTKVYKISLNLFLSCPNKERCIYCKDGSRYFSSNKKNLKEQFEEGIDLIKNKDPKKFIAYFQSNTNTNAPLDFLETNFEKVLTFKNVVGINIATRSDAISDEVLEYLENLNKRTDLIIELGLQSIHDKTLKLIKRGHTLENFERMVKKLQKRNIKVLVHIINGLPYETKENMLETVRYLNDLNIWGIKIHMIHIVKGTPLEKMFNEKNFHILTKEEYVDIVCDQLELLNENIVINRLTGDPVKEDLIEPVWLIKKFGVLNDIDKEQVRRNSYQGKKIKS